MRIPILKLIQTLTLLGFTGAISSCVHLQPVDHEFKASAEFAYNEDAATADDLKNLTEDPTFEKVEINRTLDSGLLQAPGSAYRVGPGDELDIEVAELETSRAKTKVMPDGMLYYDVAKGLNVQGKTIREISTLLSKSLENDYVNPVVSVNVSKADSQRFWMLGQVQKPGTYPITKPTTLIAALSGGGGLLSNTEGTEVNNPDAADLERSILIRDGALIPVNFESLIRQGDMTQNVYVQGGDYIFVPSLTTRSFYVLGAVIKPGPVFFERDATVLSAVSAAGGPRPDVIVNKALILRGGTLHPEVAVVNIKAIMKGEEPDLKLPRGDIV